MINSKNIIVVIPAKNEGVSISKVIDELHEVNNRYNLGDMKILIVNDSTDNTATVAKGLGAHVVRGNGEGLGSAMYLGIKEAVKLGGDIIVSIDADGQFNPKEIPNVVLPIIRDEADMVLGSRFLIPGLVEYPMPKINKIGNSILTWMVRAITGFHVTDAQTGYRAMTHEVAEKLDMIGSHTYVQETIIDAINKNFKVIEVPVKFRKRGHGGSKVVSSIRKYAIWTFPILILRAGIHMMFFTTIGLIFLISGVSLGIYLFYASSFNFARMFARLPALLLVVLLVLSGLSMFFFGFILNTLITIKNKVDHMEYDSKG